MRFVHADHAGRSVRLAYCLNLHPADDLEGAFDGLRRVTLPLRDRLLPTGSRQPFGIGVWMPADLAMAMAADDGAPELERWVEFLSEERLDPFTFNAFPYGSFHTAGLKEGVFTPTWKAPERSAYTLAVARLALVARLNLEGAGNGHLSISTHAGMYGSQVQGPEDLDEVADNMALCAVHMARFEEEEQQRVIIGIEPEPRSSANDTHALCALLERIRHRSHSVLGRGFEELRDVSETIVQRHLGACFDACHAAVEFEEPDEAWERCTLGGTPLGKLQFSSALALEQPDDSAEAREALFELDEERYLHQVTGRRGSELVRVADLPELRTAYAEPDGPWRGCEEWRCHFHVPVDRTETSGLGTTRPFADRALERALADPERWGSEELHVEIETYTWDVLPDRPAGPEGLVDGLEREYRHVLALLEKAGWTLAESSEKPIPER